MKSNPNRNLRTIPMRETAGARNDWDPEEKLLDIPYLSLEKYPVLLSVANYSFDQMNELRKECSIPARSLNPRQNLRLIRAGAFDEAFNRKSKRGRAGGLCSRSLKTGFVRYNSQRYPHSIRERLQTWHAIAHETTHLFSDVAGFGNDSHILDEGFTELLARKILSPRIFSPSFLEFFSEEGLYPSCRDVCDAYAYNREVDVVNYILELSPPKAYRHFLLSYFHLGFPGVSSIISKYVGEDIGKMLQGNDSTRAGEIYSALEKRSIEKKFFS